MLFTVQWDSARLEYPGCNVWWRILWAKVCECSVWDKNPLPTHLSSSCTVCCHGNVYLLWLITSLPVLHFLGDLQVWYKTWFWFRISTLQKPQLPLLYPFYFFFVLTSIFSFNLPGNSEPNYVSLVANNAINQSLFARSPAEIFFLSIAIHFSLFETQHFYNPLTSLTCREKEMWKWKFCNILQLPGEINDPRCICISGSFSSIMLRLMAYGIGEVKEHYITLFPPLFIMLKYFCLTLLKMGRKGESHWPGIEPRPCRRWLCLVGIHYGLLFP